MNRPQSVERMIEVIKKLPGVGPKMAERLCYHILKSSSYEIDKLIDSIQKARQKIKICSICFNMSEADPCPICSDNSKNKEILCVVETPQDLIAVSKVKDYNGLYFILGGALSPLDGIGPDDIRIDKLIKRLKSDKICEVILATDMDSKGETTAIYLAQLIKPLGIKVSRLGYGIPVGGDIEYADEVTISRAIAGRREM
ncbi:MAG: recombination mediator RecR [Endomicrobiia bacterium]|nr:recombination mediator RecR [Endomicrobiaceae bacterium]MDD3053679.1 recombination mediator RecR [Endomicrobiaceae bacterium]MDD3922817.1 recombination mediator RecR [Endomicrobiaceae bacterium]MDD5102391.1 recombination mediator RecR [Endomicrobiaceae bacterium]